MHLVTKSLDHSSFSKKKELGKTQKLKNSRNKTGSIRANSEFLSYKNSTSAIVEFLSNRRARKSRQKDEHPPKQLPISGLQMGQGPETPTLGRRPKWGRIGHETPPKAACFLSKKGPGTLHLAKTRKLAQQNSRNNYLRPTAQMGPNVATKHPLKPPVSPRKRALELCTLWPSH